MSRCETIVKRLLIVEGLLLTDKGKSLLFKRVQVDTESGSTNLKIDLAEIIGIVAEENDMIYRNSGVGGSEFIFQKHWII